MNNEEKREEKREFEPDFDPPEEYDPETDRAFCSREHEEYERWLSEKGGEEE